MGLARWFTYREGPLQHMAIVELSVADIMGRWPATARLFIDRRMHCVGCPISPYHTLADAAGEHGLPLSELVAAIEAKVRQLEQPRL